MNIEELSRRVEAVIVEQLGVRPECVLDTANFYHDLGADSLAVDELVMALEEEFQFDIPDEDAEGIETVGDAKRYLALQIGGRE